LKFRAHDTFFIRKGWLSKGMKNVEAASDVFISKENNPMDVLGIGANMVKSLRYWLMATGLTTEPNTGKRNQTPTELGRIIRTNDPYFEEMGTLWLLHYELAKNYEEATSWWYFFNEFKLTEFTREDFITALNKFLRALPESDGEKPLRTLEDDFNCIVSTYVPRAKSKPGRVSPESNIDCPLGELGLIDIAGTDRESGLKKHRKVVPRKDSLHPLILLAVILDRADGEKQVRIQNIQTDAYNAGKVFNLDIISLTALLYRIEQLECIKVERTAGLDVINILTDMDYLECVRAYYEAISQ